MTTHIKHRLDLRVRYVKLLLEGEVAAGGRAGSGELVILLERRTT